MARIPAKVKTRIASELKRFQPILSSAKARDVNESDTVTIVVDLLQYIFGYDKYSEITSEHSIRSTFCDLAIKINGSLALLIEVKSIGTELKDNHIKQAVDYGANQGIDWVVLTNGVTWKVFKLSFSKPIEYEEILTLDLLSLNPKSEETTEFVALLSKEGVERSHLAEHHAHTRILNRYVLAAVLMSEPIVDYTRRELRRISGDGKFSEEEVRNLLINEVLKRDVIDDARAKDATKLVLKAQRQKSLRVVGKSGLSNNEDAGSVEEKTESS